MVNTGMLTVSANMVGTGVFDVAAGATLSFSGSIASTDAISLAAGSVLDLSKSTETGALIVSQAGATLNLSGGGTDKLNAGDANLTVALASATTLTLGQGGFITAIGSGGNDKLIAGGANQTLTGGLGTDTLTASSAGQDTFQDTAAGLNGDTITNFGTSDVIDVTNMLPADLTMLWTQNGSAGTLKLTEGGTTCVITLDGKFTQSSFTSSSDGHGGVFIHG
jgi:Ca2+-binding RTX toxin-like protein